GASVSVSARAKREPPSPPARTATFTARDRPAPLRGRQPYASRAGPRVVRGRPGCPRRRRGSGSRPSRPGRRAARRARGSGKRCPRLLRKRVEPQLRALSTERDDDGRHAAIRLSRGAQVKLDNAAIAGRLEAFASLLDLAGAGPYTARAYRRAADLIRSTPAPIAELVRQGRARELRGIGPGIERRLRELVETGEIAELQELEREVSPELAGLARFLG